MCGHMCVVHVCFCRDLYYVLSNQFAVSQVEPLSQSVLDQKPCENAVKSLQRIIQVQGENSQHNTTISIQRHVIQRVCTFHQQRNLISRKKLVDHLTRSCAKIQICWAPCRGNK